MRAKAVRKGNEKEGEIRILDWYAFSAGIRNTGRYKPVWPVFQPVHYIILPVPVQNLKPWFYGSKVHLLPQMISVMQVNKLLRGRCRGLLAFLVGEPKEEVRLKEIPMMNEYPPPKSVFKGVD